MTHNPPAGQHRLSTETMTVTLDQSGAIAELSAKGTGWMIMDRPDLAQPFRLLVPLPDHRYNYVDGADQESPRITAESACNRVVFEWDQVRSKHGGQHDIGVRLVVSAEKDRVVFTVEVDNRSELTIENVHYPCVGAINPPCRDGELFAFGHQPGSASRTMLYPQFANRMGFCSVEHPTFANVPANSLGAIGTPVVPFMLLEDGSQGIYWGVDEPSAELLVWHGELLPGWSDSIDAHVPQVQSIGDFPVAILFSAVHVPFIGPQEQRQLTPVAMQTYVGDWHAGADIYSQHRSDWGLRESPAPTWVSRPHSWQQLQLNSAEDTLRTSFDELPEVARECRARGIQALQVVGWNTGGQDRNNPSHSPDPRLGGFDALRSAIAECQRIGVKVVLFTKFIWADRSTTRFREELVDAAIKDPYGDYYVFPGFRYDTVTQLLDINTRRLIPMCFHSQQWMHVCEEEFATVLALGADGMLHDEALHHAPALLCFDTSHGHRPGAPVYSQDRAFVDRLRTVPGADAGEFLYAAEACYDWLFETYQLSYQRSNTSEFVPLTRYLRPHIPIMTAVTGFDDRNMINQCLMYRLIPSYEPFMFKGRITAFDQTVTYGSKMNALRTELAAWFWDGTFRDTVGATITRLDGTPHRHYAVYQPTNGRPAGLVVANYEDQPAAMQVQLEHQRPHHKWRTIDNETWQSVDDLLEVPPRSAAVLIPW